MKYEKLTNTLVLALSSINDSEFQFDVIVNGIESHKMAKDEIDLFSEFDDVVLIDLDPRQNQRRWHDRFPGDPKSRRKT